MNRTPWIIGIAAVALITAGTIYAMQANDSPSDTNIQAGLGGATASSSRIVVPAGTQIAMTLQTGLTTKTANVGDRFEATMASPVSVNGRVAIPDGAKVSGHVILAEQPGKASGRGQLQLSYDTVTFGGHAYDLGTRSQVYESASGTT